MSVIIHRFDKHLEISTASFISAMDVIFSLLHFTYHTAELVYERSTYTGKRVQLNSKNIFYPSLFQYNFQNDRVTRFPIGFSIPSIARLFFICCFWKSGADLLEIFEDDSLY